MKSTLKILGVAVIFALALSACSSPAPSAPPVETPSETHEDGGMHEEGEMHEEEEADHHHGEEAIPIAGAKEIRIVAGEFSFDPAEIHLHKGEDTNIVLVNEGAIEHELEIGELGFHLHALPGETVVGGLLPGRTGEFEMGCFIPGHYEAGMKGKVFVEEAHGH